MWAVLERAAEWSSTGEVMKTAEEGVSAGLWYVAGLSGRNSRTGAAPAPTAVSEALAFVPVPPNMPLQARSSFRGGSTHRVCLGESISEQLGQMLPVDAFESRASAAEVSPEASASYHRRWL